MSSIQSSSTSSSILDFQLALKAVNGNAGLAHDLLETLIGQLSDYQQILTQASKNGDKQQLQDTLHKINGAMKYVGAPGLAQLASDLDGTIMEMSDDEIDVSIKDVLARIEEIIELGQYPQ